MESRPLMEDIGTGVTALALALAYHALSIDYTASGATMATESSGAYTTILAWGMGGCGVLCFLRAFIRARFGKGSASLKRVANWKWCRMLAVLLVLICYVNTLQVLGFIIGSWLAGTIFLYILGERIPLRLLTIPAGWALGVYVLFAKLLMIPLPLPFFMQ